MDSNLLFQRKVGGGYFMAPQRPNKSFEERKNGLWPTTKSAVSIYIIKHFRVNHILSIYQINKLISLKIWLFEFRSPPTIFWKKSINFYLKINCQTLMLKYTILYICRIKVEKYASLKLGSPKFMYKMISNCQSLETEMHSG